MISHIIIDKYVVSDVSDVSVVSLNNINNNNSKKINIIPSMNYIIKRIDISNFPIKTLGDYYRNILLLHLIKDGKINFNDILGYQIQ